MALSLARSFERSLSLHSRSSSVHTAQWELGEDAFPWVKMSWEFRYTKGLFLYRFRVRSLEGEIERNDNWTCPSQCFLYFGEKKGRCLDVFGFSIVNSTNFANWKGKKILNHNSFMDSVVIKLFFTCQFLEKLSAQSFKFLKFQAT
jgi:hypothetical protein